MTDTAHNPIVHQDSRFDLTLLLGACPFSVVTDSAARGLALGLAVMLTLIIANACLSLLRAWLAPATRLIVLATIAGSLVAVIELIMNAYLHSLYGELGIYVPLVAISCIVIACAGDVAFERNLFDASRAALKIGAGVTLALVMLGGLRELSGHGLLLAALPPGAFIGLGLLIALKNSVVREKAERDGSLAAPDRSIISGCHIWTHPGLQERIDACDVRSSCGHISGLCGEA